MMTEQEPYYRRDLSWIHHQGFAAHPEACAPEIVELLQPVRERGGLVLELGCGSGLLTKRLVDAGLQVIATDASPAMLDLARRFVSGAVDIRRLVLPDEPLPASDAVVSVGHVLSYLGDEDAIDRALVAIARALRPGGVLALDICDLEYGAARIDAPGLGRAGDDWAIVTEFSVPEPNRFVREMTTFVQDDDGSWRRGHERHDNTLIDTDRIPALLAEHGIASAVGSSFGTVQLPVGLRTVIGHRPAERTGG